jgi:hypothetical protein
VIYTQTDLNKNTFLRHFDANIQEEDLVWHRDENDRLMIVEESNGWKFQFDDELPFTLLKGMFIRIRKMKYHRLIKDNDSGDLLIKIIENF